MQKITIKDISIKTGTNDKGDWKLTNITGADGAKFSSFDHKAAELKAGDTIEAEIEIKGKNNNIKEWKLISSAPITSPPTSNNPSSNSMSKEDWAEKDRIERASIEAQVAYKGIMEVMANLQSDEIIKAGSKLEIAFNQALDWAIGKLGGKVSPKPSPEATKTKSDGDNDWDKLGAEREQLNNQTAIQQLNAAIKENGYNPLHITSHIKTKYRKNYPADLDEKEMAGLISDVKNCQVKK